MGSLDSAEIRSKQAHEHSSRIVADGPVAFKMKYTGIGSVTSVTVTAATNIVLVTVNAGTTTTDTIAFATHTTMGAVAQAINNLTYWNCVLLDALEDDASASKLVAGAISATGDGYYEAKVDTNVALICSYRCTWNRYPASIAAKPKGAHRVHLNYISYYANVNGATANGVRIYECNPVTRTSTQIWQAPTVDGVATTHSFANGEGYITSDWGNDLLVRIYDATSMADTDLYLECSYKAE